MAGRFARRASPDGEVNALPNAAPSSLSRVPARSPFSASMRAGMTPPRPRRGPRPPASR